MFIDILKIAVLCIIFGTVSIPVSFTVNVNPVIVWFGNALGSLLSALVVILIANRVTNEKFKSKASRFRVGKKVVTIFDEGEQNQKVKKASNLINKHGLKLFSFLCPIFPGVFISTAAIYLLGLDRKTYIRWMMIGVFFASGAYVLSYWWIFIRTT